MHDRLFENARSLQPFEPHADAIGLDVGAFESCMASDASAEEIRKDMAVATKAGLTGTPAFVIGLTDPADPNKVRGVTAWTGARHVSSFRLELEKVLKLED